MIHVRHKHPLARFMLLASAIIAVAACVAMPARVRQTTEATITRTTFGIPHISARDFRGLGFGAAYAMAEDNLCTMAEAYVTVAGERSRFFGAETSTSIALWPGSNLDSDLFYRSTVDSTQIRAHMARSTADYKALLAGFVAGYNHFLDERGDDLPTACAGKPWVRPITEDHVLRWIAGFAQFASTASLATGIATAAPPQGDAEGAATAVASVMARAEKPHLLGSNGWAFGGDTTINGRGVVVGNPHFPWSGAYRFYMLHMTIPGRFDVAGATILGQPYIGIGFNKDVAWTHTTDTAVHATLMRLTLDPDDPTVYLVDGRREAMTRRAITVEDQERTPRTRTLYETRYGPVVSLPASGYGWTREVAYAVRDANKDNIRGGDTWLAFGRADGVDGIRKALIRYRGVAFLNTIAADRAGNALHATISPAPNVTDARFDACGSIGADNPAFFTRPYILNGSRSACDWQPSPDEPVSGLLPGEQMFALTRRDFVQNSNDSYRWSNPALPPVARGVMLGLEYRGDKPSLRTRSGLTEIRRLLDAGPVDTAGAVAAMLGNRNFGGELVLPALMQLCKRPAAPARACTALAGWDGREELSSRGALLFRAFWRKAGERPGLWSVPFDPTQPVATPASLDIDGPAGEALLADLTQAAAALEALGVPLDAPLGQVQGVMRNGSWIPISGGAIGGTLNYIASVPAAGRAEVVFGTSYLQAVTFDATGPVADTVLAFSQSTDPASPHYADQTREFSNKRLRHFPFSEAEIAADAIGAPKVIGR